MGFLKSLGSGLADSIFANSANAKAKRATNWAWNRTMEADNTKYQRTMEDMKAAGLNPILGMSEAGASGVGQAQAPVTHQASDRGGESDISSIINSVGAMKNIKNQQDITDATTAKLKAETEAINAKNPYIPDREKKEQAEIDARTKAIKLENNYNEAIASDRVTSFFAEVEQKIVQGRMSTQDWKMIEKYGLTRKELVGLGEGAIRTIGNLIAMGLGGKQLKAAIKQMKGGNTSAKKIKKDPHFGY